MNTYETFIQIINGSLQFTIDGGILTVTGYYSGDSVSINLNAIDEEMFEEIVEED